MSRQVTFRADGRVAHYRPGKVYTETLTPYLEALLRNGSILVLIDPLTLDAPPPAPVIVPVKAEKKYTPKTKDNEESDEDKE